MTVSGPAQLIWDGEESLDATLAGLENIAAVYRIETRNGQVYLGRTSVLKRRIARLLGVRAQPSRVLSLRGLATSFSYWPAVSRLESSLLYYTLARAHFPDTYKKLANIRFPSYVRLVLSNEFPRTMITTQLRASGGISFGPFRSRATAEDFERATLDLFQLRRCQEDLEPSPDHPGCIYGEMNLCLRPCQSVVGVSEYHSEAVRVESFLRSNGESLIDNLETQRLRLSESMDFEEAARIHKRLERVQNVSRQRDPLATSMDHQFGVAVNRSGQLNTVELRFLWDGIWQDRVDFSLDVIEGRPVSLDKRLREVADSLEKQAASMSEKQEHLALLCRWFYSSFLDGEWLGFDSPDAVPYRRLVNAIHRILQPPKV